jgi:ferredoxin
MLRGPFDRRHPSMRFRPARPHPCTPPATRYRFAMNLVEVCFAGAAKTVFVMPGTTLLAAAGLAGVDVLTGCTRGMCGTDAARVVVDRPDALEVTAEPERSTLDRMGLAADCRLLCSARVRCGRVEVRGDALVS